MTNACPTGSWIERLASPNRAVSGRARFWAFWPKVGAGWLRRPQPLPSRSSRGGCNWRLRSHEGLSDGGRPSLPPPPNGLLKRPSEKDRGRLVGDRRERLNASCCLVLPAIGDWRFPDARVASNQVARYPVDRGLQVGVMKTSVRRQPCLPVRLPRALGTLAIEAFRARLDRGTPAWFRSKAAAVTDTWRPPRTGYGGRR